jgi:hypothetical protein
MRVFQRGHSAWTRFVCTIQVRYARVYGVPSNLNLKRFHTATLTQICLGEFQTQFHFVDPELSISVEGDWQVTNAEGHIADRSVPNANRASFHVHHLLGRRIVDSNVNAPNAFSLRFDSGWTLTIHDSSREFESFSINPGDIYV